MYIAEDIIATSISHWQQLKNHENQVMMLCIAEHSDLDIEEMISSFREAGIPFFGGIFPQVISGNSKHKEGAILRFFPAQNGIKIIQNNLENSPLENELDDLQVHAADNITIITLVDGLMQNITSIIHSIHNKLGEKGGFFGGGAGSLSLKQGPCLFSQDGFIQDAVILCLVDAESCISVRHGWEQLAGPFVATKTEGNIIHELNWQNAFDIYHQFVSRDQNKNFEAHNFFESSKSYPFGIYRENEEDIVRDPISVTDQGGLVCVGEVPENALLHILKGEPANLIGAAQKAAEEVRLKNKDNKQVFLVDCISRVIFLEDDFSKELEAARQGLKLTVESDLEGILSLGEIASLGDGSLIFYNKTFVITTLNL
jgi:hypothetical protein